MLRLSKLVRFLSSQHGKEASHSVHSKAADHGSHGHSDHSSHGHSDHSSHGHSDHSSHGHSDHGDHHGDHHGHEVGDHHGGHHSSHKKIPAGSWHRHSDEEDPHYYYDRYGPFHTYSFLGYGKPDYPDKTPEDEIYRHEIQGYIRMVDINDDRKNIYRGYTEYLFALGILMLGIGTLTKRGNLDDDNFDKKIGNALIVAQEIDEFIKEAKGRLA